jgi:hypothetical protein
MRPVPGFPEYLIDEYANIYSCHLKGGKRGALRKTSLKRGYLCIGLMRDKKVVWRGVARLFALAYLPGYFDGAWVNHKDGNKLNNSLSNLEWVTRLENATHAAKTGLYRRLGDHGRARPVINIHTGDYYGSVIEAVAASGGYSDSFFRLMLSNQKPNKTNFRYA